MWLTPVSFFFPFKISLTPRPRWSGSVACLPLLCWAPCKRILSSVQLLSHVRLFAIPWTAARQGSLSITNSRSILKLMPIESVMPPNHLILCHWWPLALSLSQHQGLFQWVSSSHKEAKVLALQFRIRPSKKYSESTSFRIDCLISLLANRLSRVFSSTTVWKHQFFSTQHSLWSNSHNHTWLLQKHSTDYTDFSQQSDVSALSYTA